LDNVHLAVQDGYNSLYGFFGLVFLLSRCIASQSRSPPLEHLPKVLLVSHASASKKTTLSRESHFLFVPIPLFFLVNLVDCKSFQEY